MGGPGVLPWRVYRADDPAVADLVAQPVARALDGAPYAQDVRVAAIDPALADTAEFCERYEVSLDDSANCVVIAGRRGQETSYAACMVLATTRADVNNVVRKRLDARKASFAPMSEAVRLSEMEYGGITPIGLPAGWPILVDSAVLDRRAVVIGSGIRGSKLAVPARLLAQLPGAEVVPGLANRVEG